MSVASRVAVLGPVTVAGPDGAPLAVPGALARSFLTALVLAHGHTLGTDTLIDELWGEDRPKGARAALQTLVSRLRRTTADGLVVSTSTGYALGGDPAGIDLVAAEQTVHEPDADTEAVRTALDRWRGTPGGDVDGDLGTALSDRAAAAEHALRRRLAALQLADGDPAAAAATWAAEVEAAPFDDTAAAGAMRALDADGRTAEALAVFAAHRERLADGLGADPSAELVRLNAELLRRSAAAEDHPVRRTGLRVAPNELVGRGDDVAHVAALLDEHRLVTVLGPGGLGKTRLAQAVAAQLPPTTGVVVCELAPIGDGEDLLPALGALLGIAEVRTARMLQDAVVTDLWARLVRALDGGPTVLVLDNCEHLLQAVARCTADLLAAVPGLRVLTTSRAPLAIAGEVVAPLGPLPVEADGAAVRLFTERARAARPGAVLPVDAVRRICTRLDGSPLAIELAAARIRGMAVDEVERRLDDRFALLRGGDRSAPERHRTLLAVIEWSWRLLDEGAQDLLTRLALFPDGVAVDAVESVAEPGRRWDALDDLAELVEQSLVQLVEAEGEPVRYRLLETVREFGAARLAERGTTEAVRTAMTTWGRELAAARNLFALRGPVQLVAFTEVRREADTLVTLLRWALRADDVPTVTHVFAALGGYWTLRGLHREVVATASDVVAALRSCVPRPEDRTAAVVGLVMAGATSAFSDLRTTARAITGLRTLHASGRAEDPVVDALASLLLSVARPEQGFAELARLREDPEPAVACLGTMLSAPLAENAGEPVAALRYARRAKALAETTGEAWTTGTVAVTLTQLLAQSGRYREALAEAVSAREHLERFGADDDLYEIGWTVGLASAATGDVERARSIAADLRHRPAGGRGGFDDRGLIAVLAVAIGAECARWEGDPEAAAAGYTEAWDVVQPGRGAAAHWALMAGAARIAAVDEAAVRRVEDAATGLPAAAVGAEPAHTSLPAAELAIARRVRVGTLVQLRLRQVRRDVPVIGTALAGLAIAYARTGRPDAAVACWGTLTRIGSRQDFAVLAHARLRPLLAEVVGEQALADAETAAAGRDRTEAVSWVRAVLEDARLPDRAGHGDPGRPAGRQAFRM
ncbi:BTAD domain-containing putative transcriptional regulator [Curtobacterium oceanosedimentum]|uniref:BTAD domain-containing putative transcriptional regulator n=1 Tax=Curtobacterium oceanosedimentum TaxID=465820 RepID=UPI00137ACDFF|nr:BTAD domain-containing putative transcriptional regulator [Curtobacterium oceanosedimentum]